MPRLYFPVSPCGCAERCQPRQPLPEATQKQLGAHPNVHAATSRHERGRKPVRTPTPRAPEAITFERDYPGVIDQARHVRTDLAKVAADCPVSDDLILLASELATNAILHSQSGHPDRTFTVRVTLYHGDYAWVEIIDQGGTWTADEFDDEQDADWPSLSPSPETATGESTAMPPVGWRGSGSTGSSAPSCVPMARNHRLCHSDRAGTPRIVRAGPSNLNGANGLGSPRVREKRLLCFDLPADAHLRTGVIEQSMRRVPWCGWVSPRSRVQAEFGA